MDPQQIKLLAIAKKLMIGLIVAWGIILVVTGIWELLFGASDLISTSFLWLLAGLPLGIFELICFGLYMGAKKAGSVGGFMYILLGLLGFVYAGILCMLVLIGIGYIDYLRRTR